MRAAMMALEEKNGDFLTQDEIDKALSGGDAEQDDEQDDVEGEAQ